MPVWDRETDHVAFLCSFIKAKDQKRFNHHFFKWLVRVVKTATQPESYNKQAFVLVSNKQNSGKSTFCRFLCPRVLTQYIAENIGTDKDSHVAITENFLINLDELSQADKAEINAFKSMFSKDKVKARLTYDKRASIHVRRASFIGSIDKWEFLTDENGSVRWLCMEIDYIDWDYSKKVDMDKVFSMVWHLSKDRNFQSELIKEEIEENERINKKFQISSPKADLIERFFEPSNEENGEQFYNATEILEYIMNKTSIKLTAEKVGKSLRFLNYERISRKQDGKVKHGYWLKEILKNQ
ncbi:MAG: VapE family protein [Bacteroidales bacterium]|nr:VapE family protein [Bacteroidales bacterium]